MNLHNPVNKFKVGDKVRCRRPYIQETCPKVGEEFLVTSVYQNAIGFVNNYLPHRQGEHHKRVRSGEVSHWHIFNFELVERAEDIPFNNQMKEILDESV